MIDPERDHATFNPVDLAGDRLVASVSWQRLVLLLTAGVHPKVVQERLGHSQIGITLDTYSHVMPSLQLEAAEMLDGILAK